MKIRLTKPPLNYEEIKNDVKTILDSGQLTSGRFGEEFRGLIKDRVRSPYCHLTTSATTALQLALSMLGIGEGKTVLVSDFSFPATANAVVSVGAAVDFVEVDIDTYNMSVNDLMNKITPEIGAVVFVDTFGNPSNLDQISQICRESGVPLIEDAACALGSSINNRPCGSIADVTCFSFHPRKIITTGEGGAITLRRYEWNSWLETKLRHGATKTLAVGLEFGEYGYNLRMPEISAAMGLNQIKRLDNIISSRQKIERWYRELLEPKGFNAQKVLPNAFSNMQSVVMRVPEGVNRDMLVRYLRSKNIESTLGTYSISSQPYFVNTGHTLKKVSNHLQKTTITLPCYEGLDPSLVCREIWDFLG